MLFALISIAWLAVMTLIWAVCMMARRGESLPSAERGGPPTDDGLVIWEDLPELSLKDARRTAGGWSTVRLTARGVR